MLSLHSKKPQSQHRFVLARQLACGAILLLLTNLALAAPGMIAGSRINKGNYLAEITVQLNCGMRYLRHEPRKHGDQLRIHLESTGVCNGVSPLLAGTREQHRPALADEAKLVNLEYDGESTADPILRFNFSDDVRFSMRPAPDDKTLIVRIYLDITPQVSLPPESSNGSRMVKKDADEKRQYVINLASFNRPPVTSDLPTMVLDPGLSFFSSEVLLDQVRWHRLRLGYFDSTESARQTLAMLQTEYPTAWIDRANADTARNTGSTLTAAAAMTTATATATILRQADSTSGDTEDDKLSALMDDARRAMTGGEIDRAVQIYTKVLQQAQNEHQQQAQEFLGLARERNGQLAHAKAEYQRYLDLYPESDGATRVSQRLAALLSGGSGADPSVVVVATDAQSRPQPRSSAWNVRSFFSQFYRHHSNQINDNDPVISQSSLYSDVNLDVRRRGQRFDFSSRVSAGYRNDFLDIPSGSGNDLRLSYAYLDLADSRLGLRGRVGRQSRNSGGVLGRFDGANLNYQLNDRLRFDAVAGKPVYSTASSGDNGRRFYGISANSRPVGDNLDLGVFFLQQELFGVTDRQAVGGELRYFAENKSLWGLIDYDTSFKEIGSMFLQGSWRLPSFFTVTGMVDRRRSPFLSTGNALIGQPVFSFSDLALSMTEDELRQLALDRAPSATTLTAGVSKALTPKLQLNLNMSQTAIDATPESGGVAATAQTSYRYFSSDLVVSGLVTQGDVSIIGLRYADSGTTEVWSMNLDTRFPLGQSLRINPRLRVNYRQIKSDSTDEWIYSPGIRLQYRVGRKLRLEFEAGKQYAFRKLQVADLNRESYFINLGYQFFY
jgi:hypothetical protein